MLPVVKNFNGPLELSKIVWMRRENEYHFYQMSRVILLRKTLLCNRLCVTFLPFHLLLNVLLAGQLLHIHHITRQRSLE